LRKTAQRLKRILRRDQNGFTANTIYVDMDDVLPGGAIFLLLSNASSARRLTTIIDELRCRVPLRVTRRADELPNVISLTSY
jgi:hypothetical protein